MRFRFFPSFCCVRQPFVSMRQEIRVFSSQGCRWQRLCQGKVLIVHGNRNLGWRASVTITHLLEWEILLIFCLLPGLSVNRLTRLVRECFAPGIPFKWRVEVWLSKRVPLHTSNFSLSVSALKSDHICTVMHKQGSCLFASPLNHKDRPLNPVYLLTLKAFLWWLISFEKILCFPSKKGSV